MDVIITDNAPTILAALDAAKPKILGMIGVKAEKYAKALCPVGTPESTGIRGYRGGTLRNSITHQVVNENTLEVGTNVEYAPYVELGTGPNFNPPPDWEHFEASKGIGIGKGYVTSRPYLRPAIENHKQEYEDLIKLELKNA